MQISKPPDDDEINAIKIVYSGIVALAGGVVHEIVHGKQYSMVRFVCGAIIGAFTGIIAFFICSHFKIATDLTAALTGMAGYTGAPLLETVSRSLRKMVKQNSDNIEP